MELQKLMVMGINITAIDFHGTSNQSGCWQC